MFNTTLSEDYLGAEIELFLERLYPDELSKPSHYYKQDSKHIMVRSGSNELIAFCTLFENLGYQEYLVIGNYECINNQDAANEMLRFTEGIGRELGKKFLLGPMNGDTWHSYRYSLLPKERFFLESVHCRYYPSQWLQMGFENFAEYHTNIEEVSTMNDERINGFFEQKGLEIRHFDRNNAVNDFKSIYDLSMESFKHNLFFQPTDWNDFKEIYFPFLAHINEELVDLVFDGDELVGLLFAIEDKYKPSQLIAKTLVRKLDRKYAGMGPALNQRLHEKSVSMGYKTMLHAYIEQKNYSNVLSHKSGSALYQKHVLLQKKL